METAAGQFQAALDRSCRAAELPGRLVAGTALQMTEDQRRSIALRQPVQFVVEHRQEFLGAQLLQGIGGPPAGGPMFVALPRCRLRSPFERYTIRYLVEPAGQRGTIADRGSLACEDEESRLESVLGIVAVPKDGPADA